MKNLIFFSLTTTLLIFLSSCGAVKEGFGSPKKENSDEFLVEKKSASIEYSYQLNIRVDTSQLFSLFSTSSISSA